MTVYVPNDSVEVGSTEVTTVLSPPRRASIGSTYNSGEDIATTPALSEVDGRPNLGLLAYRFKFITFLTRAERLVGDVLTQEKVKSGCKCFSRSLIPRESEIFY